MSAFHRTVTNNLPVSIPSADLDQIGFTPIRVNSRTSKMEIYVTYGGQQVSGFLVEIPLQAMYGPSVYDPSRTATNAPAQTSKRAGAAAASEEKKDDSKPTVPLYGITAENNHCAAEHGLDADHIRAKTAELFAWIEAFQNKFIDYCVENSVQLFNEETDRGMVDRLVVGMIKPKTGQKAKPGKTLPQQHIICKFAWGKVRLSGGSGDSAVYSDKPQNKTKFEMRQMQTVTDEAGDELRVPQRRQMPGIQTLGDIQNTLRRGDMLKPVIVPQIWVGLGKVGITAQLASVMIYDKPIIRNGLPSDVFDGDGELVSDAAESRGAAAGAEPDGDGEAVEEYVEEEDDA
jgi:hypothetical protein